MTQQRYSIQSMAMFTGLVLVLLFTLFGYIGTRILRLKDFSLQSMETLAQWHALDRATKEILTSRSAVSLDGSSTLSALQINLANRRRAFERSLDLLQGSPSLVDLDAEWADKIVDAAFVWGFTRRNLIQAERMLEKILQQDLVRALPPGLLQAVYSPIYRTRFEFDEIVLLMNFVNQLSILDISSNEFSRTITEMTDGIQDDVNSAVRRLIFLTVMITTVVLATGGFLYLLVRRLKLLELDRIRFEREHAHHLLQELLLSEGSQYDLLEKLRGAALPIDVEAPVMVVILRFAGSGNAHVDIVIEHALAAVEAVSRAEALSLAGTHVDKEVVLLVNARVRSADGANSREWIQTVAGKITAALSRSPAVSCSVTIGREVAVGPGLSEEYERVRAAADYRFILGETAVFFAEDVSYSDESSEPHYPKDKEDRLGEFIKAGRSGEAKELFNEIVDSASRRGYQVVRLTILQMALTLSSAFSTIERNLGLPKRTDALEVTARLTQAETLSEVKSVVVALIDDIAERQKRYRNSKHERLVEEVEGVIEKSYNDPNLSTDIIADSLGLSPSYLARLYRRHADQSVADAINRRRLDQAVLLLFETEHPVQEIARLIGMRNAPYFYTLFRKNYGVTPSRYRSNHRRDVVATVHGGEPSAS